MKQQHPELFQQAVQAGLAEYLEPEWSDEEELFDENDWVGVWIEPRPDEPEPSSEEIRLAQAAPALDPTSAWLITVGIRLALFDRMALIVPRSRLRTCSKRNSKL